MKVDLLIENALVFNIFLKRFEQQHVTVSNQKFYYISDQDLRYLEPLEVIDAQGTYMIPGLIDIHMHIESSMVPPAIFSGAALSHGVTTVVADCHEIANVCGMEGIEFFMEQETLLDIFYAIPSSVPSTTPELETTGGLIGVAEVQALLQHPSVIALGEAMNFKGITEESPSLIQDILQTVHRERPFLPLEGHVPRVSGETLAKFLYAGLTADHTHQSPASILEKVKSGMFLEFQKKSITAENMAVLEEHQLYEHIALITDDVMADDLLTGHLNENMRLAIQAGMPIEEAIYTSTYTPARRMNFQDRGAIVAGYKADFLLLDDLETLSIASVYKNGYRVHQRGEEMAYPSVDLSIPEPFLNSVHCKLLTEADLRIPVSTHQEAVLCNVIQIHPIGTFTKLVQREIPVKNGFLDFENSTCALVVVMERYGKNGNIGYGLVEQAIDQKGSIATTWAHDHHNLMVMGTSITDMLAAQAEVIRLKGGYVVFQEGQQTGCCPLPLGGILSTEPISLLGEQLKGVRQAMQALGYRNTNEIMSFSTLSLPVSPQVKITDFGMMDVHTHTKIPLLAGES
ncbi:adenine deaminase C-terminal domain-containing protein [Jeotgalibaca caeni]|uniref:adenine deaminase C-terminal domain-containing protein n=1 Tax=Jeotgalibaca caeni TaxID=3028623 RepID=UPI00237D827E|nr:adenine deaminase C-terminal domain-containing protein [Jeotgalibaca caeni]MDE1549146.1 adenine deaminase C-terminal domain-containing protein [Jeotgalibaca caeni]